MDPDRWLTVEEAAKYLRVAKGTLYNWISQRRIPFCRRGRVLRFERDALDRWLAGGRSRPSRLTEDRPQMSEGDAQGDRSANP